MEAPSCIRLRGSADGASRSEGGLQPGKTQSGTDKPMYVLVHYRGYGQQNVIY